MTIYVRYIGQGAYLHGVPARDLTESEYEKHRAAIEACPAELYQVETQAVDLTDEREDDDATGEL